MSGGPDRRPGRTAGLRVGAARSRGRAGRAVAVGLVCLALQASLHLGGDAASSPRPGGLDLSLSTSAPLPQAPGRQSSGGDAGADWSRSLRSAIDRIPDRRARQARWVVSRKHGSWGTADWYRNTIYISPDVPQRRLYDVAVHEWSHLASVKPYGGDVPRAVKAMNAYFGGSGLTGAERAADCMARLQRADWTNYTPCRDSRWRHGADALLRGKRV